MGLWWRLVHFGFRLLYNELAFTYDLVSRVVSLGSWQCWQRTSLNHLDIVPNDRVLDLAHGTGNLHIDLNVAGYRVFGHDLSSCMGRITCKKLNKHSFPMRLSRGKAQALPYASGSFATVISTFPTAFITQPDTLDEIARVLRSHGQFVIVSSGILTGGGALRIFLEWLYRVTGQRERPQFDIRTFLADSGFVSKIVQEPCPHSIAQVIVARKKG
jgi:ubiquinone/menaquinone biosynthesis C-methylase UbiE